MVDCRMFLYFPGCRGSTSKRSATSYHLVNSPLISPSSKIFFNTIFYRFQELSEEREGCSHRYWDQENQSLYHHQVLWGELQGSAWSPNEWILNCNVSCRSTKPYLFSRILRRRDLEYVNKRDAEYPLFSGIIRSKP